MFGRSELFYLKFWSKNWVFSCLSCTLMFSPSIFVLLMLKNVSKDAAKNSLQEGHFRSLWATCFDMFFFHKRRGSTIQKHDFIGIWGLSTFEHSRPKNLYWSLDSPWNSASFGTKTSERKVWHKSVLELEKAKKQVNLWQNWWKGGFCRRFFVFKPEEWSETNTISELSAKSWVDSTNFHE